MTVPKAECINGDNNVITTLQHYDILCGRSNDVFHNIGNRRFRITIGLHFKNYLREDQAGRRRLIGNVTHTLHREAGARFLKQIDKNRFVQLSETEARKKVSHAFRDLKRSNNYDVGSLSKCTKKQRKNEVAGGLEIL